jgi:3-oxoacyl-[acyl-carrier-protein] synthase III
VVCVTALDAVAVYLPPTLVPVEDLADRLELTGMQVKLFRRFHELREIRFAGPQTAAELLLHAASALAELRGNEDRVRYLLYGRAMPVTEPYPVNRIDEVRRALGLEQAIAFTVTQQSCASGLLAIALAGRLLAADAAAAPAEPGREPLALVLTGEKTFTRHAQLIPGTSVFGEASAACLVSAGGPRNRLLAYACAQRGEFDVVGGGSAAKFQREYRPALAAVIRQAADQAGIGLDDLRLILPHNVNVVTWQRLCVLLRYPLDRVVLDNVADGGHLFCSDAFVNYQTAIRRGLLAPGDRYLVATVGSGEGATFAAMVFEH